MQIIEKNGGWALTKRKWLVHTQYYNFLTQKWMNTLTDSCISYSKTAVLSLMMKL